MKIVFFEVEEWEKEILMKTFPDVTLISEKLTPQNAKLYQDAEIVSTFIYSTVNEEVISNMPQLKLVATRSTGYDHIDTQAALKKNIQVMNVPEYGSKTVAEYTFALILTLTKKIYQSINQAKNFDFFDHHHIQGVDLDGKTLGIIGLGKIGLNVLRIAKGFGMNVVVSTRHEDVKLAQEHGFSYNDLDHLLSISDIVTLHLPYSKETHHTINKTNITKFKKNSFLINTARGGLIDTEAIVMGIDHGILAGVALDVIEEEKELSEELEILNSDFRKKIDYKTLVLDHILMNHPQVIITPHNAFNSIEALERITRTTVDNIKSYVGGQPQNLVGILH